jgi:glycosyltransferase involved in cell wall biosynthesis
VPDPLGAHATTLLARLASETGAGVTRLGRQEGGEPAPTLSVFFPTWNEQDILRRTIRGAYKECRHLVELGQLADFELIIVDDASTDATADIARELAAESRRIRVVTHKVNRQLGGAIKSGIETAQGDLVLYMDSDMPCEFGEIGRAVRIIDQMDADMISAYRHDRTTEGPRRALYSFVYNGLCRILFKVRIRDVNFSFKMFRRALLDLPEMQLQSDGSFIDVEILVRAKRCGANIVQFGVDFFPRTRGISALSSWRVIAKMLAEMSALAGDLGAIQAVSKPWLRQEKSRLSLARGAESLDAVSHH